MCAVGTSPAEQVPTANHRTTFADSSVGCRPRLARILPDELAFPPGRPGFPDAPMNLPAAPELCEVSVPQRFEIPVSYTSTSLFQVPGFVWSFVAVVCLVVRRTPGPLAVFSSRINNYYFPKIFHIIITLFVASNILDSGPILEVKRQK